LTAARQVLSGRISALGSS